VWVHKTRTFWRFAIVVVAAIALLTAKPERLAPSLDDPDRDDRAVDRGAPRRGRRRHEAAVAAEPTPLETVDTATDVDFTST